MTCKLGITFTDESKDFFIEKFCQSTCQQGKRRGLQELLEKAVLTWQKLPIVVFATSVYIHVNNQQPRVSHTTVNDSCPF